MVKIESRGAVVVVTVDPRTLGFLVTAVRWAGQRVQDFPEASAFLEEYARWENQLTSGLVGPRLEA
jgi:hypothetical protein